MVVNLIGKHNSDELCYPGEDQVSMQSFFILSTTPCQTEVILDVVDISFDNCPDLISGVPFVGSTDCSGIGTEILFGVDINHTPTR